MADFVAAHVDIDRVREIAGRRPLGEAERDASSAAKVPIAIPPPGRRIALARDEAFSFIYPHVLEGWRGFGRETVVFSPLAASRRPPIAIACWLPGGYPELHAGRLAAASAFLEGLRGFARTKPVHGECGGYMVLGKTLIDASE